MHKTGETELIIVSINSCIYFQQPTNIKLNPGGVPLGIFGRGVPTASPDPDPISDQKMLSPPPVFRPGLKNPYPFSDLTLNMIKPIAYASVLNGSQCNKDE